MASNSSLFWLLVDFLLAGLWFLWESNGHVPFPGGFGIVRSDEVEPYLLKVLSPHKTFWEVPCGVGEDEIFWGKISHNTVVIAIVIKPSHNDGQMFLFYKSFDFSKCSFFFFLHKSTYDFSSDTFG